MSVERSDKDTDADENVDADRVWTERPVGSEQSIDLFTQHEEIDIDFRVSGLSHAVVREAEHLRVQVLVKKIESHPHREALQADLQQSDAYNPFSKKKSQWRWFVTWAMQSFLNCARQFLKCNAKNAFFVGIKALSTAPAVISWKRVHPADIFTNGDWMFFQSRTTSSRRSDLMALGMVKLKHRRSTS